MSNAKIFGGRCWIPPEWRVSFRGPVASRWPGGRIAITGASDRQHAAGILLRYLPLLEPDEDTAGHPDLGEFGGLRDAASARRMLRRQHAWPVPGGVKALLRGGIISQDDPGVYVWHRSRAGQEIYQVSGDRHALTVAGQFEKRMVRTVQGREVAELVASRGSSGHGW